MQTSCNTLQYEPLFNSLMKLQPHAVLDVTSRHQKALKIERLLHLSERPAPIRLLEVGTGSGGIAHYFANHPTLQCDVTATDVLDQRKAHDGYEFRLVEDVRLPFPNDSFDAVISNHVIEHVGDRNAQRTHLAEIWRVMKATGVGYLAVPNRWMLVEPHYRLPFLSWLPVRWRSPYLRLMRRGLHYDCTPLRLPELDALLSQAGFRYMHMEIEALQQTISIEGARTATAQLAKRVPTKLLAALRPLIPTLICRLEPIKDDR